MHATTKSEIHHFSLAVKIGLDGIRMLDPNTSRTLRIYPLENITRCEVTDSSTLAFWSKSSVDIEPRRIRLQSNSYTTNTLLDIVTAATVQENITHIRYSKCSMERKCSNSRMRSCSRLFMSHFGSPEYSYGRQTNVLLSLH